MAVLTVFNAMTDGLSLPTAIDPVDDPRIVVTSTSLVYKSNSGFFVTQVDGTGFSFGGGANGGTVTSLTVRNVASQVVLQITGLNHSLVSLFLDLFGIGTDPNKSREGSGLDALTGLLTGNDFLNGSAGADNGLGGYSDGNDVVRAFAGADTVGGDAGNDSLNGGNGFDTLSYSQSYFDPRALRGVQIDAVAGTARDPWGFDDTFSFFEDFVGSKLVDAIRGSGRNESFSGLGGNDLIDGRGGFDSVLYAREAAFDGLLGIRANLTTGKIKDGFGNTDTVLGIEKVLGTFAKDIFGGSARDETFEGLAGKDAFNGKGGIDTIDFSSNTSPIAVQVALSLASGNILNDGWGQKETALGIENIIGSRLGDSLFGDNRANVLVGGGGGDALGGNGGSDTLTGNAGADRFSFTGPISDSGANRNVDTVTDLRVGVDTLVIDSNFSALGDTVEAAELRKGATATNGDQHLIYNPATGELFYDADGLNGVDQILFAILSRNLALSAGDFAVAVG
jgi:Ca2+-binding RTX toxin-like protein